MKNCFVFLFLLNSFFIFGQSNNQFEFRSIENGLGIYFDKNPDLKKGISGNLEFSGAINSNIFSVNTTLGYGLISNSKSFKNFIHIYLSFDLMYGREIELLNDFYIEPGVGIGTIYQTNLFNEEEKFTLNIPARVKIYFKVGNRTDLGINSGVAYNSINTIFYNHIILKYNF